MNLAIYTHDCGPKNWIIFPFGYVSQFVVESFQDELTEILLALPPSNQITHITHGFNWIGFAHLHIRSEHLAARQCMFGRRKEEVIFDLTGVFMYCLGEGYGCLFVIISRCCIVGSSPC